MTDYIQRRFLCVVGIIGIISGLTLAAVESSNLPTSMPNPNTPQSQATSYSADDLMKYRASTTEYKVMIGGVVLTALSLIFTILMIKLGIFEQESQDQQSLRPRRKKKRVIPYQHLTPPTNDIVNLHVPMPRQQPKPQLIVHTSAAIQPAEVSYSPELTSSKLLLLQNKQRTPQHIYI